MSTAVSLHECVCHFVCVCVINPGCPLPPPTGEKMTEIEIDALMTGQEDENGCVNYEGELQIPTLLKQLYLYYKNPQHHFHS